MDAATREISSWVKLYTNQLYSYAFSRVNDKEAAEDIVQNTFLAAVENYFKFEKRSRPKTWLFAILKNKIADHLRQKYKEAGNQHDLDPLKICFDQSGAWKAVHFPTDVPIDDAELLDNPEFITVLKTCFDVLPAKWSAAVHLRFFEAQNSRDICEKLGITLPNYWQMIHRAKMMLRLCLDANWFRPRNKGLSP